MALSKALAMKRKMNFINEHKLFSSLCFGILRQLYFLYFGNIRFLQKRSEEKTYVISKKLEENSTLIP